MKRGKPIQRKTRLTTKAKLAPGTKRLRASRSTTTPTKAESAHLGRVKQPGKCVACYLNEFVGLLRADQQGCDAHHTLSGGRRRGHGDTLGLCPWHHRGLRPASFATDKGATLALGPSLAHGSKAFHAKYGPDDYLLSLQKVKLHADAG